MNIIGEVVDNVDLTWYIRGANLLWSNADDAITTYLYNGHNDVVATIGASENDYLYDAFGNQVDEESNQPFSWREEIAPVAEASYNPFRYCGEYFDYETGYIYLRARYYDSANGRFISEDPIRDGLHWYVYCASNPVAFTDPTGLADPFKHHDGSEDAKYGEYKPGGYVKPPDPPTGDVPEAPTDLTDDPKPKPTPKPTPDPSLTVPMPESGPPPVVGGGHKQSLSDFYGWSDEEVWKLYNDKNTPKDLKKKAEQELKFRNQKNKGKQRGQPVKFDWEPVSGVIVGIFAIIWFVLTGDPSGFSYGY